MAEKREPKFRHYKPKRWHPEFNLIVFDSISGLNNKEIGAKYGYHPVHVSNILNTEQAEEIREKARKGLNESFEKNLSSRVNAIGEKALSKIEDFVNDKHELNLDKKQPFTYVDKMMKLAVMTSKMSSGESVGNKTVNNVQVNGNAAFVLNGDQADGIRNALLESGHIDSIGPGTIPDKDIEDPSVKLKLMKNG